MCFVNLCFGVRQTCPLGCVDLCFRVRGRGMLLESRTEQAEARQQPQKGCEGDDEHARREGEVLRLEHDEEDAAEGGNGERCLVGTLFYVRLIFA